MKSRIVITALAIVTLFSLVTLKEVRDHLTPAVEAQSASLMYVADTARVRRLVQDGAYNAFTTQTATGATAAFLAPTSVLSHHTIELITTGGPATCTYRLQGSNDNVTWFNISAADITCTTTIVAFETNKPVIRVRGNLLTLTGGTTPSVTLKYAGR